MVQACWEARWEALNSMNPPSGASCPWAPETLVGYPSESRQWDRRLVDALSPRGGTSAWRHRSWWRRDGLIPSAKCF